jgi:transposase
MAKQLVDDALWEVIKPLLPPPPKRTSTRGRPRLSDRAALTGILFVLRSGLPWEMLPKEMGCGSGMTCWRRLRDWHRAGVWRKLHRLLLSRLEQAGQLDWSRASIDSVSVRAKGAPRKKGAPSGRTRRTAANRARNAIRW